MEKKYVSLSKLSTFLDNLKTTFSALGHKHTVNDLTDYTVDSTLSSTSTNPVQNKVVNEELEALNSAISSATTEAKEYVTTHNTATDSHSDIRDAVAEVKDSLDSKANASHNHDTAYDTKGSADTALASAKTYADNAATTAANTVKNDLLNGAGAAYDTLKELGDLIDDNTDAIEALETVASGKADANHNHTYVTNGDGTVEIITISSGDYSSDPVELALVPSANNGTSVASIIPKYSSVNLGTKNNPWGNLYISSHNGMSGKIVVDDTYYGITKDLVNQNAFSKVAVGSTTIEADSTTDTLTLAAGSNITLTADATGDKVTIAATNTAYTHPNSGVTAGTYKSVAVDAQGHVTAGSNPTTLAGYGITDAETKGAADTALASAKTYADTEIASNVATLESSISSKADASHTHDDVYYTESEIDAKVATLESTISSKADASHTHDDVYYTESEIDEKLSGKADAMLITTGAIDAICDDTYTVSITGNPNSTYAYATINGEVVYTKDTYVYHGKPTISVYVYGTGDGEASTYVKVNGTKMLSGPGTYDLDISDTERTITLKFSYSQRLTPSVYYISNCQITTTEVDVDTTANDSLKAGFEQFWSYVEANDNNIATELSNSMATEVSNQVTTGLSNKPGLITTGTEYGIESETFTAGVGAEIFNCYENDSENNVSVNVASGSYSHAEGGYTTASGNYSHAEGCRTTASGDYSHAEGYGTTASGDYSHAEGYGTTASGDYSHAEGYGTTASGDCSHAEGYGTTTLGYQHVQGHYNKTSSTVEGHSTGTTGTAFVIGCGTSSSTANAFRITYAGKAYATTTSIGSGADYAEYFEWEDGNLDNEDRRGYFVTLDGKKIKIAEPNDYILGIISGMPCVIGNGDEDWKGRYILDDFGAYITEEFEYEEEVFDEETKEIKTVTKIGTKYKENSDYDQTMPYVQREDRPEWDAVGMMGVLSVRDDGTCQVNGYCTVAEGGTATASEYGYRVIERVNDNVVKVVFR